MALSLLHAGRWTAASEDPPAPNSAAVQPAVAWQEEGGRAFGLAVSNTGSPQPLNGPPGPAGPLWAPQPGVPGQGIEYSLNPGDGRLRGVCDPVSTVCIMGAPCVTTGSGGHAGAFTSVSVFPGSCLAEIWKLPCSRRQMERRLSLLPVALCLSDPGSSWCPSCL